MSNFVEKRGRGRVPPVLLIFAITSHAVNSFAYYHSHLYPNRIAAPKFSRPPIFDWDRTNRLKSAESDDWSENALNDGFDETMPKINSVTLTGRIGNDPEPRYFDDGNCVLNLSLAVKRKYHPVERQVRNIKYGEEETDWFGLEIWGKDAEFASKFLNKGARIGVTGGLNIDSWTDKVTGEKRIRPKIVVRHFDVLETKAEAGLRQQKPQFGGGNPRYNDEDDDEDDSNRSAGSGNFFG